MPWTRFSYIRQFICYYDVWTKNKTKDPLFKINYFIEFVLKKSQELYQPDRCLAIDESMIKFKGEHKMRIYVINKPI